MKRAIASPGVRGALPQSAGVALAQVQSDPQTGQYLTNRGDCMSESRTVAALQAAQATIQRHLLAAFSQLDSETPDVEIRKQLYADLIRQAVHLAGERFPNNRVLVEMIEKIFGHLESSVADAASLRYC
jgi:hypothetical protein